MPQTPKQNGVAERLNRTLVETASSMLLHAKLPKSYWGEAVNTAMDLKNRSPSRSLKGVTPYEAWFGVKPQVKHLRVFGCDAFAHVLRDERGKFDSKTRKCILVGYSLQSKAYRLYDPQRRKLIVSRDVKFSEEEKESTPQVPETQTQTDRYVIVETGDPTPIIDSETPAQPEDQPSQQPPPRRSAQQRIPSQCNGREVTYLCDTAKPITFVEP